ncbi:MAG TPA: hypothetical protein VN890_01645 [Methylocella sp.]|nr:hypothetical protein [Methylocella sp.]
MTGTWGCRWCFGKTPMQTLLDAIPIAKEKRLLPDHHQQRTGHLQKGTLCKIKYKLLHDILDPCCFAWNKRIDMPWKVMFIGSRDRAYRS